MAALWDLPVIYVIENNRYGMGTSVERSSASTELYQRGASYGIPGRVVDGMDVLAVAQEGADALDYVRSGKGPLILEMQTYRYRGHSMSDPAKYRSKEEVQKIRSEKDPIETLKQAITAAGVVAEADLKEIDKQVKSDVTAAAEFAQNSPEPDPRELFTDILMES